MLDLRHDWLDIVRYLLDTHVPDAEVWAYGSRVTGGAQEASDLDLVLRNPKDLDVPNPRLGDLREAFSESDLPILVDLHDWARIPESFRKNIERTHEILSNPTKE